MSNVYGNSYLNIAATSAPDGRYGLFQVGKDHRNTSFRAWTSGKSKNRASYHCVLYDIYEKSMREAPLMQRAWVVQERLLSSRTVHFTSTRVFWECDRETLCEAYRRQMHENFTSWESRDLRFFKKSLLEYRWDVIVHTYTSCSLRFGQDKLPAISGVADAMKISKKCEYIAGLWADDSFLFQLCWKVYGSDRLPKPKYRAPSWSWAAVDSPVTYAYNALTTFAEGYQRFYLEHPYHVEISCFRTAAISSEYLEEASGLSLVLKCKCLWPITQAAIDGLDTRQPDYSLDYLNRNMEDLYLLFVAGFYDIYTDCLIVEKTLIKQGQYRRVGYVRCSSNLLEELEGYEEFRDKSEQGKLEEQDLLPPDSYIKDLRSEKSQFVYQIEVI